MSVCVCKVRNFVIYEIIFICLATNSNFLFNIEFTIWFSSSIFQSFVLGLPLLLLSGSNPVSRYVVQIILVLVFAICISVVGFIFLPKMLRPLLATGPEHRHLSVRAKFGAPMSAAQVVEHLVITHKNLGDPILMLVWQRQPVELTRVDGIIQQGIYCGVLERW